MVSLKRAIYKIFGHNPQRKRLHRRLGNPQTVSKEYYQKLHDTSAGYQSVNWLVPELDRVLSCRPKSLLEIGFGNGLFLKEASDHVDKIIGIDWAKSEMARELPDNVTLRFGDINKVTLPSVDLVCSGDVLEHIHPNDIAATIEKIHHAGKYNFHIIACYDDGHSHLSVISSHQWEEMFQTVSKNYRIVSEVVRPGNGDRKACIIANYDC